MTARACVLILLCLIFSTLGAVSTAPIDDNSLYDAAAIENEINQQIRVLITQLTSMENREGYFQQMDIDRVKEQLESAQGRLASVLHNMLGLLYWSYFLENRYKIIDQAGIVDIIAEDIASWDLRTITNETIKEYRLSLAHAEDLQRMNIRRFFPSIVAFEDRPEWQLRPTLYDLLAHIALDFFIDDEFGSVMSFEDFSLEDAHYLSDAASFSKLELSAPDSPSLRYLATKLFQDLISFHLDDADPQALLEVDLQRLAYVHAKSTNHGKEQLYETALRNLLKNHEGNPASANVSFHLASLYRSWGDTYSLKLSEEYRLAYRGAIEICQGAINKYPDSFGAKCCLALAEEIEAPLLDLNFEDFILPGAPFKAFLYAKNISGVKLRIYRIPYSHMVKPSSGPGDFYYNPLPDEQLQAYLGQEPLRTQTTMIASAGDLQKRSYELTLDGLPKGFYLIIASNTGDGNTLEDTIMEYITLSCTNISYVMSYASPGDLLLLNRRTGEPLTDVQVTRYDYPFDRKTSKTNTILVWSGNSDADGMISIPLSDYGNSINTFFISGADSLFIAGLGGFTPRKPYIMPIGVKLYTDRAIYRPGQTVHVKGVCYEIDAQKRFRARPNRSIMLLFHDSNDRHLAGQSVASNEFGTFDTSFTIPQDALYGQMTIKTGLAFEGSVNFNVEEYTRPSYGVTIEKPASFYKLGQEVSLKGVALGYSGLPVYNAQVYCRISREPVFPVWQRWWGRMPISQAKQIKELALVTDEKGEFTLNFTAVGGPAALMAYNPYYVLKINVDVTNTGGETRSVSLALNIGEKELLLNPELPEYIDSSTELLTIPLKATTLDGTDIPLQGQVMVSRLHSPDRILRSRLWTPPDRNLLSESRHKQLFPNDLYMDEDQIDKWEVKEEVFTGDFDCSTALEIDGLSRWAPGVYKIEFLSQYKGQGITESRYFTVYDARLSSLPYPMADWFVPVKVICEPGEDAQILVGSGYSDVSVLFEVEKDFKTISKERFVLQKNQRLLSIPVTEEDRGGFYAHITFVREGRLYSHVQRIEVPWTDKQLEFEYMTFSNRLLPGQNEQWRLKLKDHTGEKVSAEVLASMYDSSLDAFYPSAWSTNIFARPPRYQGWRNMPISRQIEVNYVRWYTKKQSYPYFNSFDDPVCWPETPSVPGIEIRASSSSLGSAERIGNIVIPEVPSRQVLASSFFKKPYQKPPAKTLEFYLPGVEPYPDFAETAFFYPRLHTDEDGEVIIAFTAPESLTEWKFRALAVTEDLQIGFTEHSTATLKPFMVRPNAPRFLREGDKIIFSAKISSLDGAEHTGVCQLLLFDALTMNPVDTEFGIKAAQQAFRARKDESALVSWDLDIPYGISALTYQVLAKSSNFLDSEKNTLPILSKRILVTKSLSLPMKGKSKKAFAFDKLLNREESPALTNHKLTFEYSSNSAWYAIQALPYLMQHSDESNEQTFSRFYANALASHIANANPRIKSVFDSWKGAIGPGTLFSHLEKDEELRAVLSEETPWVWDMMSEAESKQRLGLLFDYSNMKNQIDFAVTKLEMNQSGKGKWAWFPGGEDSRWITQYIVEGSGHLHHLNVRSMDRTSRMWQVMLSAMKYIDREIQKDYQKIMEEGNPELDNLGYLQMHYLYARSFFADIPISDKTQIAMDYFKIQADRYWMDKDTYGQGLIALARHRHGNRRTPGEIMAALTKAALHDKELGMWWDDPSPACSWYQDPIRTQALMLEAFHELSKDPGVIDELRTWLIKQKQSSNWGTTTATAQACYALLLAENGWRNIEKLVSIKTGKLTIDPMQMDTVPSEARTGYFKTSWPGNMVTPSLANITVTNPGPEAAWGGLYGQYFEDPAKTASAETSLGLKKELFLERNTDSGKMLDPINEASWLQIGDKVIVRIELRADRDLEYLHLKDMRSAGLEPIRVFSGYKWQDDLGYYESTDHVATDFFIDYLSEGTYVFEYPLRVVNKGDFSGGITTIQCMYAPEFSSYSEDIRVKVK